MATLGNIQAKIAKLQAQAEALVRKESSGALEKIHALMQKHGITTADIESFIGGKKRGRKSAAAVAPKQGAAAAKYLDPKTGATWTGHGRAPAWIANAKDRTKFLVEVGPAKSVRAASKTAKAGNYVRGPQAPKYRDPKSGATWSGRGRAPAWLAGAKDPSKFLIDVADEATSAAKPAAKRKSSARRKVAVKKPATAKKVPVKKAATKAPIQASKKAPARRTPVKKAAAKKAAAKKAPAKHVARRAAISAVADAATVANVAGPTEGAETT
ncbi:H-NS histone family protein [Burkholderia cenocepacia]|uniref:H-NS family nucleoid-associated regulatory protein n=2 Tax=Burkholderia cenocepacia TaxID=95486 RepID=UPI0009B040EA|nr:H-NS family nucleoid-associated regulatory protein [Burkholderia cenocepacia]MBR7977712.1 H-NS histone family protein [Burkholderia cenocepacia]MBR7992223.1 H-NS histone family protein [Burkholderia cenocepacia]